MAKFHVNKEGNAEACNAGKGANPRGCPFGGDEEHYSTKEAAQAQYEQNKDSFNVAKPFPPEEPTFSRECPKCGSKKSIKMSKIVVEIGKGAREDKYMLCADCLEEYTPVQLHGEEARVQRIADQRNLNKFRQEEASNKLKQAEALHLKALKTGDTKKITTAENKVKRESKKAVLANLNEGIGAEKEGFKGRNSVPFLMRGDTNGNTTTYSNEKYGEIIEIKGDGSDGYLWSPTKGKAKIVGSFEEAKNIYIRTVDKAESLQDASVS